MLKSWGKTPGNYINDKITVSKINNLKKSPNKKDWEGGPGMLSNANLIKNCCCSFHKAYKIAKTMREMVNIAAVLERRMILFEV